MPTRGQLGLALAALVLPLAGRAHAQATHTIDLRADREARRFGFTPATISARAGDILVFKVGSGPPHSIAFDPTGLARADQTAINRAMTGRVSELRGPLLVSVGETYRMVVPRLTPGTYRFYCLTHQVYGAAGSLVIK